MKILSREVFSSCFNKYLLKFATIMGMGRVIQRTPQMAHSDATNLPAGVLNVIWKLEQAAVRVIADIAMWPMS